MATTTKTISLQHRRRGDTSSEKLYRWEVKLPRYGSRRQRQADLVDPGEVVRQHLLYAAFLLRFLFQGLKMLEQLIPHGVGGLEL